MSYSIIDGILRVGDKMQVILTCFAQMGFLRGLMQTIVTIKKTITIQ